MWCGILQKWRPKDIGETFLCLSLSNFYKIGHFVEMWFYKGVWCIGDRPRWVSGVYLFRFFLASLCSFPSSWVWGRTLLAWGWNRDRVTFLGFVAWLGEGEWEKVRGTLLLRPVSFNSKTERVMVPYIEVSCLWALTVLKSSCFWIYSSTLAGVFSSLTRSTWASIVGIEQPALGLSDIPLCEVFVFLWPF